MKTLRHVILFTAALMVAACGGKKNEAEPADVVVMFHKLLTALDFGQATGLCCGHGAEEYVATFENAYKEALSKEASAAEIAAGMLGADEVVVGETSKDKDMRTVFYTIGNGCGNKKDKIAVLKKVEGEWKITEIKDR
jgi:hypothetical protein